jgi:murein DD-endopeptidase
MVRCLLAIASLCSLLPIVGLAQSHSPFPVDIVAGPPPQPVTVDGHVRLVYELHLTNFAPWPIEVTGLDVLGDGTRMLASYHREALEQLVVPVENLLGGTAPSTDNAGRVRVIGEGHSVVIFLNVTLDSGAVLPAELRHRFTFSITGSGGSRVEKTVNSVAVLVSQQPILVLQAPLRGRGWIAFNAYSNPVHRRSFNPVDGRIRIAERFAVDWMCIGPDGRLFRDDSKSNDNFYDYGAEVLAVADGRVSDLKDGFAENIGISDRNNRVVTLENIVGNYLTLDLGHGRFALYAHLQPGSLKVKLGDKVRTGQILGRLGNSGNSDEPHLHFQVMDANSPMGAEGIPYELETFTQLGLLDDPEMLDTGQSWRPTVKASPLVRRLEFPLDNAVLTFR